MLTDAVVAFVALPNGMWIGKQHLNQGMSGIKKLKVGELGPGLMSSL